MIGHAEATAARIDAGGTRNAFPIWLLVNAAVTTSITALMGMSAVLAWAEARDRNSSEPILPIEAGCLMVTALAWSAFAGRRRGWNDGVTTLLALPSLLLNLAAAIGIAALLAVGPV